MQVKFIEPTIFTRLVGFAPANPDLVNWLELSVSQIY